MEQPSNPDEMIEIKPDVVPGEDEDITLSPLNSDVRDDTVTEASSQVREAKPDRPAAAEVSTTEGQVTVPEADVKSAEVTAETEVPAECPEIENLGAVPDMTASDESDDFSAEFEEIEQEQADYEILEEIGDSIINQVDAEIENTLMTAAAAGVISEEPVTGAFAGEAQEAEQKPDTAAHPVKAFFAKIPMWVYLSVSIVICIGGILLWFATSDPGRRLLVKLGSRYAASQVNTVDVGGEERIEVPDEVDPVDDPDNPVDIAALPTGTTVVTPELTPTAEPTPEIEEPETIEDPEAVEARNVYNILLIGEENIYGSDHRGRSDLIMIASLNREQKAIKLISIMRDSLVSIPGYLDNRVNAAYAIGGVSLLYETLKVNLGIEIDNYMLVNFENFENIVDALGGVDIELTETEAKYLNTTNYISKPEYRSVSAGMNHLNGNQALGYCRIRHVGTADHEYSDFGRTARQRQVLNAIYGSIGEKSYISLFTIANKCLPYITTDLDSEGIENCINLLAEIGTDGIENYRIPIGGTFSDVRVRDMLVTQIDLEKNAEALRLFIYGE